MACCQAAQAEDAQLSQASLDRLFNGNTDGLPALSIANISGPTLTAFFRGSTREMTLRLSVGGMFSGVLYVFNPAGAGTWQAVPNTYTAQFRNLGSHVEFFFGGVGGSGFARQFRPVEYRQLLFHAINQIALFGRFETARSR